LSIFLSGQFMHWFSNFFMFIFAVFLFVSASAWADRPAWAGGQKGDKNGHSGEKNWSNGKNEQDYRGYQDNPGRNASQQGNRNYRGGNYAVRNFDNLQRSIIYDYFGPQFRSGRCPPGLAKKHNGCFPPGQAKQWRVGYPLPQNIIFYNLPPALIGQLGYPRPGYRYVRVAADILLIAAATGMVIDVIENINAM
jgi:hypothetical protein